jgi:hypothetical protein
MTAGHQSDRVGATLSCLSGARGHDYRARQVFGGKLSLMPACGGARYLPGSVVGGDFQRMEV